MSAAAQDAVAVVVPFYNELSRQPRNFTSQLRYFSNLANTYDTFLVDDGSNDGSYEAAQDFFYTNRSRASLVSMRKNGKKVRALHEVVESLPKTEGVI
jgi:glycosyltransferase involved in cell wall biosynthesis